MVTLRYIYVPWLSSFPMAGMTRLQSGPSAHSNCHTQNCSKESSPKLLSRKQEGGREGGREERRKGGREGGRKGGREGGREEGRKGEREGKRLFSQKLPGEREKQCMSESMLCMCIHVIP